MCKRKTFAGGGGAAPWTRVASACASPGQLQPRGTCKAEVSQGCQLPFGLGLLAACCTAGHPVLVAVLSVP